MSLHRADARFLLPEPIANATVLGEDRGWVEGLEQAGVQVVTGALGSPSSPQLAVAPVELAREAVATGAAMIILEGKGGRLPLEGASFRVQRYVPLPFLDRPDILLPVSHARASTYGLTHFTVANTRRRRFRRFLIGTLFLLGRVPELRPVVTLGLQDAGPPFFVSAATSLGIPQDSEWFLMLNTAGDPLKRGVFHLFESGKRSPGWVLKFSRVPDQSDRFRREARGLSFAQEAGGDVALRSPTRLGAVEAGGLEATVEVAVQGRGLTLELQEEADKNIRLGIVETIARWILDIGRQTIASHTQLLHDREQLREIVVPRWASHGITTDLLDRIPPIPAVLQHNDLGPWNVVYRRGNFVVCDWEAAQRHGFPVWDLIYFLVAALRLVDEPTTPEADASEYYARLLRGEAPSSPMLFAWLRRAQEVFSIPEDGVAPLVTFCWLWHALVHAERRAAGAEVASESMSGLAYGEKLAAIWLSDRALGPTWVAWL